MMRLQPPRVCAAASRHTHAVRLASRPASLPLRAAQAARACPRARRPRPPRASVATDGAATGSSGGAGDVAGAGEERLPLDDLNIHPLLVDALYEQDIVEPTEIQVKAAPVILGGQDVAIRSYTGSGKTLAFLLPILTALFHQLEEDRALGVRDDKAVKCLIVAPSQELAMQIVRVARSILPEQLRPTVQQAIGGANMERQIQALRDNRPLVVAGTPGRLSTLSRLGKLGTHTTRFLVLDEADQLLARTFADDMERIMKHTGRRTPGGRRTIMTSATISPQTVMKAEKLGWIQAPEFVYTGELRQARARPARDPESPAPVDHSSAGGASASDTTPDLPPNLRHACVLTAARHRVDTARRVIHASGALKTLIFVNHQRRTKDVVFKLRARGLLVEGLHGELGKQRRQDVMRRFRLRPGDAGYDNDRGLDVLVVNDVAARGLDVPEVGLVINLEMPSNAAHYAHRAGRTGRAGREGLVVSVVEEGPEMTAVERISKGLGVAIERGRVGGGRIKLDDAQEAEEEEDAEEEEQEAD
ncbi:unnamed protein product [Pedinophyceae sp. YPF-701]|nr:unnamed protein product [Pedinophyceae sp. YPF-701]